MTFLYICKIDNMKYYRGILSGFKKTVRHLKVIETLPYTDNEITFNFTFAWEFRISLVDIQYFFLVILQEMSSFFSFFFTKSRFIYHAIYLKHSFSSFFSSHLPSTSSFPKIHSLTY